MKFSIAAVVFGASSALASPLVERDLVERQAGAGACFVIGKTTLPKEVSDAAASIAPRVKCNAAVKTIDGVPDVIEGDVAFSKINFAESKQTPLAFALENFKTATPLASTDLKKFQAEADVYTATEAGIRSVGGNFAPIKIPKFFLAMQISRIQTAQGNPPKAPGQDIDHLRDKVLKNSPRESKALLDQVTQLATVRA
ncbi:hypothetical protein MGG_05608 [Pyricularia oryzae 70-15]|uniref:DUF7143 domain-containing protein n=3 Tax=Pyricularia oryzae TaxID=318829 RepID=G4MN65_PYRO7|nr:uncharacterized protein MGG_05608 [Pyricularia oryzae 70-15]EHA57879.1 hypothetical protein MGG_05608 [Pyricularia oryzae 70-15]ELQ36986.1 hypothetical protein OOU_Y34scaffold00624g82 [Pyricularia oryzae Y34]KAI7923753.1 hypothetical protein M9X92_004202 [Pyricularia oryzae]KAI7931270.1 hypothetical protein M0657_001224 [Pyricularia oryzae]